MGTRWRRRRLWALYLPGLILLWSSPGAGLGDLPTSSPPPPLPAHACSTFSKRSCEECLKNVSCLWCNTNNTCLDYPVKSILPPSSLCSLSDARWAACWSRYCNLNNNKKIPILKINK
uniref:PSI domain-containing protein n=1 Tax=Sphenodon punctatus TaxID=8508 RepID=A0A8D0HF71_SPHPU